MPHHHRHLIAPVLLLLTALIFLSQPSAAVCYISPAGTLTRLDEEGLFCLQAPAEGVITSPFGKRTRNFHSGLDIAADEGTEIRAAADGIVTEADWKNDAYGWTVMLLHPGGTETLYAHCSRLLVQTGDTVAAGEAIAAMGSTGNSTGPHVHFEVRRHGECQNPENYLFF